MNPASGKVQQSKAARRGIARQRLRNFLKLRSSDPAEIPGRCSAASSLPATGAMINNEINQLPNSAKITELARGPTNSPEAPGIKATGIKVSTVVRVEPNKGTHKCLKALVEAATGE